jgi:acylphosphatase
MTKARLRIQIYGIVQGVFFRSSTEEKASNLGLTGWVKNRRDGSVEILAEGNKDDLESLLAWCKKGSEGSKVDRIESSWEDYTGEFKSFYITYG